MAAGKAAKIALVRGDSLNEWEGRLWDKLGTDFEVTGFCSKKNLYGTKLSYPVSRLITTSDNFLMKHGFKFGFGVFQKMFGLEKKLCGFDIAHTSEIYYSYTSQAVCAKKNNPGLKVVCTVWDNSPKRFESGYWPRLRNSPSWWMRKMNRVTSANAKGVDLFLAVTQGSKRLLIEEYGVDPGKIKVVYPGLFPFEVQPAADIKNKYSLDDRKIFLSVCRLVKEKGIYDILEAWRGMSKDFLAGNVLVMVGKGPEKDGVESFIKENFLEKSVKLLPFMPNDEIRSLHAAAECLILASHTTKVWQEQFGYVLVEAMSVGTPVVAARTGAIPEVVGNGGLLFEAENPADLRKKLSELGESRESLSQKALEQSTKFEAERFRSDLINIYKTLLNEQV